LFYFLELTVKFIEMTVMLLETLFEKGRESLLRRGEFWRRVI